MIEGVWSLMPAEGQSLPLPGHLSGNSRSRTSYPFKMFDIKVQNRSKNKSNAVCYSQSVAELKLGGPFAGPRLRLPGLGSCRALWGDLMPVALAVRLRAMLEAAHRT